MNWFSSNALRPNRSINTDAHVRPCALRTRLVRAGYLQRSCAVEPSRTPRLHRRALLRHALGTRPRLLGPGCRRRSTGQYRRRRSQGAVTGIGMGVGLREMVGQQRTGFDRRGRVIFARQRTPLAGHRGPCSPRIGGSVHERLARGREAAGIDAREQMIGGPGHAGQCKQ